MFSNKVFYSYLYFNPVSAPNPVALRNLLNFLFSVTVCRMSRSIKEKYENTNPRRTHVIMSPEEAASGKKTSWSEMEITGN